MRREALLVLGELESDDLKAIEGETPRRRATAVWTHLSARTALFALAGIATASIALRIVLAREVHAPIVFMDELGYERMAQSLAHTGHFALFGKTGTSYAPLYPIVLSPVYALTSSAHTAYEWVQVVNSVLLSLSVFPVYAIARFVLSRPRALGVAALSAVAPLMFYADLQMSESFAYPLTLVAIWAMLRAIRDPGPLNDAMLVGTIVLASAARLQQVALFPAAITAILLVAVLQPERGGRLRAVARAVSRHRLLFGLVGVALLTVLVRTVAKGGALPLAGRYSNVGSAHASPLHVLEVTAQHLAAFDFALGVIPFVGALVAAYALARAGFPRNGLVFGAVALGTAVWLLLEVGFDAAAFDRPYAQRVGEQLPPDASRFHERYLIYLVPLFLVALVAALRTARPCVPARAHLAAAAAAAALPAAIPFGAVINDKSIADSFGLQVFAKNVGGTLLPFAHSMEIALGVGAVLGLSYMYAVLRPRPSFAIVMTVVVFLIFSSLARVRIVGAARTISLPAAQERWVDRAVGGGEVALVSGAGADRAAIVETAFENLSISRLYYVCTPSFESAFGEQELTLGANGGLRDAAGLVHARYAVVPARLGVPGRVLGRYRKAGLVLVAPAGGVLTVPAASRAGLSCGS